MSRLEEVVNPIVLIWDSTSATWSMSCTRTSAESYDSELATAPGWIFATRSFNVPISMSRPDNVACPLP